MARYSEAHNRAHKKWVKENKYRATITFDKEIEEKIRKRAEDFGSVNAYIIHLVSQDLKALH